MANVISSSNYDGALKKSANQEASDSTASRVQNQPIADFEGEFVVVPQSHFNVETEYNGVKRDSSRFAVANLAGKYPRSFRVNDLEASVAILGSDAPEDLKTETVKDRRDGVTEVVRLVRRQLTRPVRACVKGIMPLITEGKKIKVTAPFKIKCIGYVDGLNVSYVEQENNAGHFDVELDKDGQVVFNKVSMLQFEVDQNVTPAEVKAATALIEGDAQLKDLYVPLS